MRCGRYRRQRMRSERLSLKAFRASGLPIPRATVVANAVEMRANLLRTGRYLSIVPEFWLQFPVPHPFVRKLPVELPIASGPIGIFTLKNRVTEPGRAALHRLRARSRQADGGSQIGQELIECL